MLNTFVHVSVVMVAVSAHIQLMIFGSGFVRAVSLVLKLIVRLSVPAVYLLVPKLLKKLFVILVVA